MKKEPIGIFYLDYSPVVFPKSQQKLIIGYTRSDFLQKIAEANIPETYHCWLQECRTPGYLSEGTIEQIRMWIDKHMSENFGESWK